MTPSPQSGLFGEVQALCEKLEAVPPSPSPHRMILEALFGIEEEARRVGTNASSEGANGKGDKGACCEYQNKRA